MSLSAVVNSNNEIVFSIPIRVLRIFTRSTLRRLSALVGDSIILSQDPNVFKKPLADDIYFSLVCKNGSDHSLIIDRVFDFFHKDLFMSANELQMTAMLGTTMRHALNSVQMCGLASNYNEVKLWFLGLRAVTLLNDVEEGHRIGDRLNVMCRILIDYLATKLPNSTWPDQLKIVTKSLSDHERIIALNKPFEKYLVNMLDLLMNGCDSYHTHRLYAVLLMLYAGDPKPDCPTVKRNCKAKAGMPCRSICHCVFELMSMSMIHTISKSVGPGWERAEYAHELLRRSSWMSNFYYSTHPHFCGHCGAFQSRTVKLRSCKVCKKNKLVSRYLFCSMECQIKSWPYHKWLHRVSKIKISQ